MGSGFVRVLHCAGRFDEINGDLANHSWRPSHPCHLIDPSDRLLVADDYRDEGAAIFPYRLTNGQPCQQSQVALPLYPDFFRLLKAYFLRANSRCARWATLHDDLLRKSHAQRLSTCCHRISCGKHDGSMTA